MDELSNRSAQEVLDDHLNLAQRWATEQDIERIVEEDLRRVVALPPTPGGTSLLEAVIGG